MRIIRLVVVAVLIALLAAPGVTTEATADDDPVVRDDGGGFIEGSYGTGNQPGGHPEPGRQTRSDRPADEAEASGHDIGPATNCERGADGELLTPWDCPVEPVDVMDRATAEQLARRIVVRLQLPTPTPQFGPDPSVNEWDMAAVGYPLWLWTEGPRTVTSTESGYGLTFTLQAHYRHTVFDMGDGHTRRCTNTTAYHRGVRPGAPSPTCGYTYADAATGDGTYTVTATTHWDIDWSVAGFSGTLPGTHTASRELPVGELQAIVVR